MKNYYNKSFLFLMAFLLTFIGFSQDYSSGVFILNEGMIGTETASISFIDSNDNLENYIFSNQNQGMVLGDTGQSIGLTEEFAYIVLNYSNEVKVVNRTTFEFVDSITDQMENPRHIAFYEDKAYVTNWGDAGDTSDDYIAIIDLATNTITGSIPVAEGPESILEKDGNLYVAHEGGYGFGNTVSIIDVNTHEISTVEVGDVPSSIQIDGDFLYVLCSGKPLWAGDETQGKLYIIDLLDLQIVEEFAFGTTQHPEFLSVDATYIYYLLDANIYKMSKTDNSLPTTPFIDTSANSIDIPYSFNKIDDKLYLGDAVDYVSAGKVFVYAEDGSFIMDHTVGQLPSGFYKSEVGTANVPDFETIAISLYPNPTSERFMLNTADKAEVIIYDLAGRSVKAVDYDNMAISITDLNAGIYVVRIEIEGKSITRKLIVQ